MTPEEYEAFRNYLERACGIVLGDNKTYLVTSRLGRVLNEQGAKSFSELLSRVSRDNDPRLRETIIEAMTTNETLWFRDTYPFEILKNQILVELSKNRTRNVRIWSAACSSGQEPYSISMAIQEFLSANPGGLVGAQILATDISSGVLNEAKVGIYDEMALSRGLSAERRQRFFSPRGDAWEVRPLIRSRVTFTPLNLLQSYGLLGRFDVIFCRNVLIYFSSISKADILSRFAKVLNSGGYLFLGSSESISGYSDDFEMVRCNPGVVYRLR